MIFSKEQMFTDTSTAAGQTLNAAATVTSTNVIDLGDTGSVRNAPGTPPKKLVRDVGPGEPVAIWIGVNSVAGANTLKVDLIQSTAANMAAPDILATSRIVTLAAGVPTQFGINFLPDGITKRFIALSFTTTTAAVIGVDAGITLGKQSNITVAAA